MDRRKTTPTHPGPGMTEPAHNPLTRTTPPADDLRPAHAQARFEGWLETTAQGSRRWLIPVGALLYVGIGILSQKTLIIAGVSPIWPGAGIALLFVLWLGWRGLIAVWLSDVAVSLIGPTGADPGLAAATATATAVESGLAATLVIAVGVHPALRSVRDTVGFVAAISTGAAVGATIGAAALVGAGLESSGMQAFKVWWLADTCGAFLVGGLGLVVSAGRIPRRLPAAKVLAVLAAVALAGLALNLVGNAALVALIPAVTLAAAIGRSPGALAAAVLMFVLVLPFAEGGESAFADRGSDGILELEFIFVALTVTLLVLASTLDARDRAMSELTELATTDELTGLPNRFGLESRLRDLPEDDEVGLVLLNVDRFKLIRSGLGYEGADRLLVRISERLSQALNGETTLARLEGDEFAVLAPRGDRGDAITLAERCLREIGTKVTVGGDEVSPAASGGVAWCRPTQAMSAAAAALQDAKSAGGGTWRLTRSGPAANHPLRREAELREAIARGELVPFFQPVVRMSDESVTGFEALARWQHPERGLLSPAEFITVAEQSDVVNELGACMLRTACTASTQWPGSLTVSVNLSANQLGPDLERQVGEALTEAGLPPERVELELTERVLLDHAKADRTLRSLRRLGIRLALDDFGTGWSSFAIAQEVHLDTVKIDRSFVSRIEAGSRDRALVAAMVAMARAMDARVIAEGVETRAQHETLAAMGVDAAQGFLYAKPMSESAVTDFLAVGVR